MATKNQQSSLVGQTVVLSSHNKTIGGHTARRVTILREYRSDGVRMYDARSENEFTPFAVIADVYDKLFLVVKQTFQKGDSCKEGVYNKQSIHYTIKSFITAIVLLIGMSSHAQIFEEKQRAFDAALNITGAMRSNQDLGVTVSAGVYGRSIPVSLFVGVNYMELDNYGKVGIGSATGINGTLMLRIKSIDWRDADLNAFSTVYRDNKRIFYEYGVRVGLMPNNRSRLSLSLGIMKERNYHSFCIGSTFSLYFWNGFNAY
jgi:hypothetical protein